MLSRFHYPYSDNISNQCVLDKKGVPICTPNSFTFCSHINYFQGQLVIFVTNRL